MQSRAIATLSIAVVVTSMYGCATVGPMTKQELNSAYSDKTVYYKNGETELTKADGTAIYDSKKGLQIGKWWPEHGKICFKYEGDRKTHCSDAKKKGEELFYKKSISFKSGDPENLEQKYNAKVEKDKAEEEKKKIERERVAKEKEAERQRVAAEREERAKNAKKLIGKKVKWKEMVGINSDDCMTVLWKTICHSVDYRFEFTGVVSSVDAGKEVYNVKLSSAKLVSQDRVAPMYWTYKDRALAWGASQPGNTRQIEYKYVSKM